MMANVERLYRVGMKSLRQISVNALWENDRSLGRNGFRPNDVLLHDKKIVHAVDQIVKGVGRMGPPPYSSSRSKHMYT